MRARWTIAMGALATGAWVVACGGDPVAPAPESAPAEVHIAESDSKAAARPSSPSRPWSTRASAKPDENSPPVIRSLFINPATDEDGTSYWMAEVSADDADGDAIELHYVWYVNGEETEIQSERFDPSAQGRGDRVQVEVWASDGKKESPKTRTGSVEIANAAPEIQSAPPSRLISGTYHYDVEATDPEGDAPLLYELTERPDGMKIDPYSGQLVWRPTASQFGKHKVVISVSDGNGGFSTQQFELPIVNPNATDPTG